MLAKKNPAKGVNQKEKREALPINDTRKNYCKTKVYKNV